MALVTCPECGRDVSTYADACPSCGFPMKQATEVAGAYIAGLSDGLSAASLSGSGSGGKLLSLAKGDMLRFGNYGGEPIEWRVLEVQGDRALLISEKALDCRRYHHALKNVTWSECSLRSWLNGEFLNAAFNASDRNRILEVRVSNDKNPEYETAGGPNTLDKAFCLSIDEVRRLFANDEERICWPTDFAKSNGAWTSDRNGACLWWLRSPGGGSRSAARVNCGGNVRGGGYDVSNDGVAVRPALWINL